MAVLTGERASSDLDTTDRRPPRSIAIEAAVVLAVAAAIAIVFTWPLVAHVDTEVQDRFDGRFQAWTIDWVQHRVRHPSEVYDANIFTPESGTLAYSDSLFGLAVPLLPLRWLGMSPVGVLNVAVLLGYTFSAAAGYLFGRLTTRSIAAGAVAGAAFAFGEFGAETHLHIVFRAGVAVAATLAWVLADRARAGARLWPWATGLAVTLGWQCSVSFYTGAYALLAAAVVLAVRWRDFRQPGLGRRGLVAAGVALGSAAGFAVLLALPYLARRAALPEYRWTLSDFGRLGADFFRVKRDSIVWGDVLPADPTGAPVFPGVVLLLLAGVGAVAAWRDARWRRVLFVAAALIVTGVLMALGTSDSGWLRFAPYRLVFEFVPGGSALRATFRAWMIGLLGLGVLAGMGAAAIARLTRARAGSAVAGSVAVLIVVGLVLAEGWHDRTDLDRVRIHSVDAELARRAEPGGVLYLPVGGVGGKDGIKFFDLLNEADHVYGTTAHHRPTANGYSGFYPDSYFEMSELMVDLPDAEAVDYLRNIGVRFVVVQEPAATGRWTRLASEETARPLRLVGVYGTDRLYEIPPAESGG